MGNSAHGTIPNSLPMTEARTPRYLPLLVLLFIGSGCAALIYEIVWFQILELVIGASSVSLAVLLGTFMGGMCAGSLLAPRFISRLHHPFRVYAALELGIGAIGLVVLFCVPLIGGLYTSWAGDGLTSMLLRGTVAAIFLLPPTFLMGATLPAISRWVQTTPQGVSWLGFFYGGNIAGAVGGSLLAGFYLLRLYDVAIATFVAVGINITVALFSLLLARRTPYEAAAAETAHEQPEIISEQELAERWPVYLTIALSGLTALAAEVLWFRLLAHLFGATVYAFTLELAAFLCGLGIGSSLGSAIARKTNKPRIALGWCQMLICAGIAWTAYQLMQSMPFWPIDLTLQADQVVKFQLDFVRCLWALLPASILWGMSFPLALASVASRGQDAGRLVGGVYAANTVGAIIGSLMAGVVLVSWIGMQDIQKVLIAISAISGLLMLAVAPGIDPAKARVSFALTVILAMVLSGLLVLTVPELNKDFVAYGRLTPTRAGDSVVLYVGEGNMGMVAVSTLTDGTINYHNAGKIQASSEPADMRLQRVLGHLTTLIPPNPKKFLVIGFGAGVTAGAVSVEPALEQETIVEIEKLVPEFVSTYFSAHNSNVMSNPKVTVRVDDGRHFLLTTDERFDGITSDPLDPWFKGAAALYTKEFFEAAKAHLTPGGVVTQWVALYESNEAVVKSVLATFFDVFPNGAVFANTVRGLGYDLVLLGQAEPIRIDVDQLQAKLDSPRYSAVKESLREIGFYSATELLATYAAQPRDLQPWLKDAVINRDRNMRLQYLAGMNLNRNQANDIYKNMVSYGPFLPQDMFTGSESKLSLLQQAVARNVVR
jgi:spermidine synthase